MPKMPKTYQKWGTQELNLRAMAPVFLRARWEVPIIHSSHAGHANFSYQNANVGNTCLVLFLSDTSKERDCCNMSEHPHHPLNANVNMKHKEHRG
jgi:hypothetical protein